MVSNVPIVADLRDNPVAIADFSTRALETNNLEDYRNRLGRSYYGAKRPGRFRSRWFAPRRTVQNFFGQRRSQDRQAVEIVCGLGRSTCC